MARHFFQCLVACFGVNDLHHFYFVKLVLANHAARVAPVAACFGAKARRVGGEFDGQVAFCHDGVAYHVCEWYFAGGDEVKRGVVGLLFGFLPAFVGGEQVAREFGQLACAAQALGIDDVGRVALGVAVLLCLCIEHELG